MIIGNPNLSIDRGNEACGGKRSREIYEARSYYGYGVIDLIIGGGGHYTFAFFCV